MNLETLKEKAQKLRAVISALKASDPAAARLSIELEPLNARAERKEIDTPIQ